MTLLRLLPRFRQASDEMETLAYRERWSRDELETFQLERLNAIWAEAIVHVPWYRELHALTRMPERFDSLDEYRATVPVLSKDDVRARPEAFLSERARKGDWHRTGGSTGAPMRNYWGIDGHREILRTRYRHLDHWGLNGARAQRRPAAVPGGDRGRHGRHPPGAQAVADLRGRRQHVGPLRARCADLRERAHRPQRRQRAASRPHRHPPVSRRRARTPEVSRSLPLRSSGRCRACAGPARAEPAPRSHAPRSTSRPWWRATGGASPGIDAHGALEPRQQHGAVAVDIVGQTMAELSAVAADAVVAPAPLQMLQAERAATDRHEPAGGHGPFRVQQKDGKRRAWER